MGITFYSDSGTLQLFFQVPLYRLHVEFSVAVSNYQGHQLLDRTGGSGG